MKTNIPDVWGPGSIFAFSGLDGENTYESSLAGYLKNDGIGVAFRCKATLELAFDIKKANDIDYMLVASDAVHFKTKNNNKAEAAAFMFLNENTIVGFCSENAVPYISFGASEGIKAEDSAITHSSGNEHAAFIKNAGRFVLCVSHKSQTDAAEKAKEGLAADMDTLLEGKYGFFERLPKTGSENRLAGKTLAKCFSIMKSQVYSPQGEIKCRWTTPDRLPHKKMWLWDSVFHALGNKYISTDLAADAMGALFYFQKDNGFIPHMMAPPPPPGGSFGCDPAAHNSVGRI